MILKKKHSLINVAYYGGFFNPIHKDHMQIIKKLFHKYKFQKIFVVLSKNNNLKQQQMTNVHNQHRLNMLRLALEKYKFVKIITLELEENNFFSYTSNTLKILKEKYSSYRFSIVVGEDHLLNLEKWRDFSYLKQFKFIFVKRNNVHNYHLLSKFKDLNYQLIDLKLDNFSSTAIRNGLLINGLLKKTLNYINKHNLYLDERLQYYLGNDIKRIKHCHLVGRQAIKIAQFYHLDAFTLQQLSLAGKLHDITKRFTYQQHQQLLKNSKYFFMHKEPLPTLHAYSGAALLKKLKYPKIIINAVFKHTCGAKKMSFFEKIIFVADKTCADRKYPNLAYYQNLSTKNLNLTFKKLLEKQYQIAKAKSLYLGVQIKKSYRYWIKKSKKEDNIK